MKNLKSIITLTVLICFSSVLNAQDLTAVKKELEKAALKEQSAFKNGDCDTVLAMMADDITFLANGRRVPSKQVIAKFCNAMPRPFKTPTKDQLEYHVVSEDTGYTIRTLNYPFDDEHRMEEHVTKIWHKVNGEWKIQHLHSTVKKVPVKK